MPEPVFQAVGDLLTKALLAADFDLYASILTLPVTFTPQGGKSYTISDEASLRADFDLYVSIIKLHGVTDIYRRFLGVDAVGPDTMVARWRTHILVRATLLAEPFVTRMHLRKVDSHWRIAEIESSEGHLNWTLGRAVVSPGGIFESRGE